VLLEDAISGTLARCIMYFLLTISKDYACNHVMLYRNRHFFTSKKEQILKKVSAARIASLAAFIKVYALLFFLPKKLLHFVY